MGLAMSRSLGDAIVHTVGVSAEPELMDHEFQDNDEFIIMGTDGVWDVIDNNQVRNCEDEAQQGAERRAVGTDSICLKLRRRHEYNEERVQTNSFNSSLLSSRMVLVVTASRSRSSL